MAISPDNAINLAHKPLILRSQCLEKLHNINGRIVVISASAGYGKTTLVEQWLGNENQVVWLSFDHDDNDIQIFITKFKATLQKIDCHLNDDGSHVSVLSASKLDEGSNIDTLRYLVFDNYDQVQNPDIHRYLNTLLEHWPHPLVFVVISRGYPPLQLAKFRLSLELYELNQTDLAFQKDEVSKLVPSQEYPDLDEQDLDTLLEYTEGWLSAIRLIQLQAGKQLHQVLQIIKENQTFTPTYVWEYIEQEIFLKLDELQQRFLMTTSLLSHFNLSFVRIYMESDVVEQYLDDIRKQGLVVEVSTPSQSWFRYSPLVKAFLNRQRHKLLGYHDDALHLRASRAWLEIDQPLNALVHAKLGESKQQIANILNLKGWALFSQGHVETLKSSLELLTSDDVFSYPNLVILRAWLLQNENKFDEAQRLIRSAQVYFEAHQIPRTSDLDGELKAFEAQIALNQNQPEKASILAEQAISQLNVNAYRAKTIATSVIGEVQHVFGELARALSLMQQTERMARQHSLTHQALWSMIQQSEILLVTGQLQTAYDLQENAFQFCYQHQLQNHSHFPFLERSRIQTQLDWGHTHTIIPLTSNLKHRLISEYLLPDLLIWRANIIYLNDVTEEDKIRCILLDRQSKHPDWLANYDLNCLLVWYHSSDYFSVEQWLTKSAPPSIATNHFRQLHWRNMVFAHTILGHFDTAIQMINVAKNHAKEYGLDTQFIKNEILLSRIYAAMDNRKKAESTLLAALSDSAEKGLHGEYHLYSDLLFPILQRLAHAKEISHRVKYQINHIIEQLVKSQSSSDERISGEQLMKLFSQGRLPESLSQHTITRKEWLVLVYIYNGSSNEQIALHLSIAPSTVKTHIRNLYNKLGVSSRKEAKTAAADLFSHLAQ